MAHDITDGMIGIHRSRILRESGGGDTYVEGEKERHGQ
jgi:hypothetical protein